MEINNSTRGLRGNKSQINNPVFAQISREKALYQIIFCHLNLIFLDAKLFSKLK